MDDRILTDIDIIALGMLFIMAIALGVVGGLAWGIYRSSKRYEASRDRALEDLMDGPRPLPKARRPSTPPAGDPRPAYEKDPDWWKA